MELLDAPVEESFDAVTEIDGVAVIRWPRESTRAVELARIGIPRVLLVAPDADPPDATDPLCEWVRMPADERDLQQRVVELRSRASAARPIVGDHGLLWRGETWVALSPIEARLAAALVGRPGRVISRARLEKIGWPHGAPNNRAVDGRIKVLRTRVAPVGLRIHTVRGQGYLVEIQPMPEG
jgi:hypothetical protein